MSNELEKRTAVSDAGRKMEAAIAKLAVVQQKPPELRRRGYLLFGLDLTGSREASLSSARLATATMFDTIKAIGSVAVKLIYYRGNRECRTSAWHNDPAVVSRTMQGLTCESGYSQIRRVLRGALDERAPLNAVVFIGDHCEEQADELTGLAAELGDRSIPLFIFHECADSDQRALEAKPLFKRMAEISGGVYCEFKPSSADVLRELLSTVGAFSVAWQEGVKEVGPAVTPEARQLQNRLLLPASAKELEVRPGHRPAR